MQHTPQLNWLGKLATFAVLASGLAQAGILVQHTGTANPATEGFSLVADSREGHAPRGLADPNWKGEDSWWFACTNPAEMVSSSGYYQYVPSTAQLSDMNAQGWQAEMRVLSNLAPDNGTDYGVGLVLQTTTLDFEIYLGADSSNHVILYKWNGSSLSTIDIAVLSADAYHTYALTAAPGATQASISIDGTTVGSFDGFAGSFSPYFGFGSFSGNGVFNTNYSGASISVIPEPASLGLLALGGLVILRRRLK